MKNLPMYKVRQEFPNSTMSDVKGSILTEIKNLDIDGSIKPNDRVAITAGSRGVANMPEALSAIIEYLQSKGARPFLVPAMGSHGGATAEGQKKILASYGITQAALGVPIEATMDVVEIGSTPEGVPVFLDAYAHEADHIVVVNRVKPHTGFKASIESGLMKMMAIGLGKRRGADLYHRAFIQYGTHELIVAIARVVLQQAKVLFGVALVENQREETAIVRAIRPEAIEETEKGLLRKAKRLIAKIPFDPIDVLIVDVMGKEMSGTGMDTNVIGRNVRPSAKFFQRPKIKRIVVRDLSHGSYGNAGGIGNADYTTKRLVDKIDHAAIKMNLLTSCAPELARIPIYFDTDREAIAAALDTVGSIAWRDLRVVHLASTMQLQEFEISEAMLDDLQRLTHVEIVTGPYFLEYDNNGNLLSQLKEKIA